ncbi:DNA polymerase IV [Eubacterium sp. An11]|uniref:DNA polymerase IV n=1 Tax=Eubacterium sp. An11 TaxID=1965542 RepID=UPI000B364F25|nr:DNA polymerase IV [Eubacterium sp. An11]OUQ63496.1 DNA polymerase IV [Eubacterium sp. An11]
MERTILHSDMNCFYASVEMLHHPELAEKPLAVGGDPEARHGIVLTANYIAKKSGVKTGMALWQAKQVCPEIIFVPPRMDLYLRFSRMAQEIYSEYTDLREPFGIDESWLDVSASTSIKGDGMKIANEISKRIKHELGVTVSIGVSWNKIFAKLGSDYKKPDAITEFSRENYKNLAWNLPAGDLIYVGRSTNKKLQTLGIKTIGELANTEPAILENRLGKMGLVLHTFANGWDETPVCVEGYQAPIKSIGNSTTTPRDLVNDLDVKIILMALSESVASRLRENGFQCKVVEISIRDNELYHFSRQCKLKRPTNITDEIVQAAYRLFKDNYRWEHPIRSLGVRGCDLVSDDMPYQLDLFISEQKREKLEKMDQVVDEIRARFGYKSIQRAFVYQDKLLAQLNAREHTVHPQGYFHG